MRLSNQDPKPNWCKCGVNYEVACLEVPVALSARDFFWFVAVIFVMMISFGYST